MGTFNTDAVIIGGNGRIWTAPAGTSMPASLTDPLAPAFVDTGWTTEDGAKFTDSKTVEAFQPWQSFYAIRRFITSRTAQVEFTMAQWDADTIPLAFGGGTLSEPAPGEFRYAPPDPDEIDERAIVIDIFDGAFSYRVSVPRCFVTSNTESTFARTGPSLLPVTLEVLAVDTGAPWTFDSDNPAWAEAS